MGSTTWDVDQPAWVYDGTLHVGTRTVRLDERVDQFVLGATGVSWVRGETLLFTSADGAEGPRRLLAGASSSAPGRLSPDRSTLFDLSQWPSAAVAYDAVTGEPTAVRAPWAHFTLGGFRDQDTFYGVAEAVDDHHPDDVVSVSTQTR